MVLNAFLSVGIKIRYKKMHKRHYAVQLNALTERYVTEQPDNTRDTKILSEILFYHS